MLKEIEYEAISNTAKKSDHEEYKMYFRKQFIDSKYGRLMIIQELMSKIENAKQ
jgi:hypothetical protein